MGALRGNLLIYVGQMGTIRTVWPMFSTLICGAAAVMLKVCAAGAFSRRSRKITEGASDLV